jgi:hypothetical protein
MGASSGAGKGEGASIVYNKEMGGPMKIAPSRRATILDKSPAGTIIGKIADKNNLKRRKSFLKKEGVTLSSMDDAYIVSPAGKAEINRKTGGKYDAYNEGKLGGNVGGGRGPDDNAGSTNQTQTQSQTALLSSDATNTETLSDEVITETAAADTTTEQEKIVASKRANKVKTKLKQKDDELTLEKKVLLGI